jgi:hypothetical protein
VPPISDRNYDWLWTACISRSADALRPVSKRPLALGPLVPAKLSLALGRRDIVMLAIGRST